MRKSSNIRNPESACSREFYTRGRTAAIVTNAIFLVVGLAYIGLGLWWILDPDVLCYIHVSELNAQGDIGRVINYMTVSTGGALLISCIIALVGLGRKNPTVLTVGLVFTCVTNLAQLTTAILALINLGLLGDQLRLGMQEYLQTGYMEQPYGLDNSWDRMQIQLRCCGVASRDDWVDDNSIWYQTNGSYTGWDWPSSCCYLKVQQPGADIIDTSGCQSGDRGSMHVRGCYPELKTWLGTWSGAVGGCLIFLFLVLTGLIVVMGFLTKEYRDQSRVGPFKEPPTLVVPLQPAGDEGIYWKNSREPPSTYTTKSIKGVY